MALGRDGYLMTRHVVQHVVLRVFLRYATSEVGDLGAGYHGESLYLSVRERLIRTEETAEGRGDGLWTGKPLDLGELNRLEEE